MVGCLGMPGRRGGGGDAKQCGMVCAAFRFQITLCGVGASTSGVCSIPQHVSQIVLVMSFFGPYGSSTSVRGPGGSERRFLLALFSHAPQQSHAGGRRLLCVTKHIIKKNTSEVCCLLRLLCDLLTMAAR